MKEDVKKFSVIKSNFKIFEEDGVKYILKEINPTTLSNLHEQVQNFTLEYISRIKKSGIPLPEIKKSYIRNNKIFFVCKYHGENIFQLIIQQNPQNLIENKEILSQIVDIFKKAKKVNLDIDPHPKNFVLENNKLYYVDFSPPYLPDYNEIIMNKIAEEHKDLVKKNFNAFSPDELGYHFAGDLLKENSEFEQIMSDLYSYFTQQGIVNSSFEEFMKKANEIKDIELERIKRGIFLI